MFLFWALQDVSRGKVGLAAAAACLAGRCAPRLLQTHLHPVTQTNVLTLGASLLMHSVPDITLPAASLA